MLTFVELPLKIKAHLLHRSAKLVDVPFASTARRFANGDFGLQLSLNVL